VCFAGSVGHTLLQALHAQFFKGFGFVAGWFFIGSSGDRNAENIVYRQCGLGIEVSKILWSKWHYLLQSMKPHY